MVRRVILLAAVVWMALAAAAWAAPPTLIHVGSRDLHPTATFSTPEAGTVRIVLASAPERSTDGWFFLENVRHSATLEPTEIVGGRWVSWMAVDPGTYWVLLHATPDLETCRVGLDGFRPECAHGFSEVQMLVVPRPAIRYTTSVHRWLNSIDLTLTARPLGDRQPYRICYRSVRGVRRCLTRLLDGTSWATAERSTVSINAATLARTTTFAWYVGGTRIAVRRVTRP